MALFIHNISGRPTKAAISISLRRLEQFPSPKSIDPLRGQAPTGTKSGLAGSLAATPTDRCLRSRRCLLMNRRLAGIVFVFFFLAAGFPAAAQQAASVSVSVKNHRFQPAQIHAPAKVPVELRVKNLDATPMEFESVSLRVEKVVAGNSEGVIRLRPLDAGSYNFFDDFNPQTKGVLVVR